MTISIYYSNFSKESLKQRIEEGATSFSILLNNQIKWVDGVICDIVKFDELFEDLRLDNSIKAKYLVMMITILLAEGFTPVNDDITRYNNGIAAYATIWHFSKNLKN